MTALSQWINNLSIWTRLLFALLVVEIITMSIVVAATIGTFERLGAASTGSLGNARTIVLLQSLAAVFAFGATAIVAVQFVKALAARITVLTHLVNQQVDSSNLNLKLDPQNEDEFGLLIKSLNRLGESYHNNLRIVEQRAHEMETINVVAATINRTFDLQEVLDVSLREVLRASNCDVGAMYMWDERTQNLNLVSYVGLSERTIRDVFSFQLGHGLIGETGRSHEMIVIENSFEHPKYGPRMPQGMPKTQVGIPFLDVPGKLLGVMMVGTAQLRTFSPAELKLLRTVAHQVSLAIDKAQLYAQVSMHAEELEQIVQARTKMLNEAIKELSVALEKAKEADRVKSLLLSTVSHELRTPLATIKGNTSMLRAHHKQLGPDDLVAHLGDIEEETDKLTDLISSLLEMSRIDAGILRIQPHPFEIVDVLASTVNAAQLRMPERDVTLKLDLNAGNTLTLGDARRVDQIVANLMNNAAKYSAEGQAIEVALTQEDDMMIVSVRDFGKGIAPEYLEHIFDRFYQIGNTGDSTRDGVGLGLAICKGLVDAHGGKIWVESTVGVGSTFSFSLPAAQLEEVVRH